MQLVAAGSVVGDAKVACAGRDQGNTGRCGDDDHGRVLGNGAAVGAQTIELVVRTQSVGHCAFGELVVGGAVEVSAPVSAHAVLGALDQSEGRCRSGEVVAEVVRAVIVGAVLIHREAVGIGGNLRADFRGLGGGAYGTDCAVVVGNVAVSSADVGGGAIYDATVIVVVREGAAVSVGSQDGARIGICSDFCAYGDAIANGAGVTDFSDDGTMSPTSCKAYSAGDSRGAEAAFDGAIIVIVSDNAAVTCGIATVGADEDVVIHTTVGDGATFVISDDAADVFVTGDVAVAEGDVLYGALIEVAKEALVVGVAADTDAAYSMAVTIEGAAERVGAGADGGIVVLRAVIFDVGAQFDELAGVIGAAVDAGGQLVQLILVIDDVWIGLGACVAGGEVLDRPAGGDDGVGGRHFKAIAVEGSPIQAIAQERLLITRGGVARAAQRDGSTCGVVPCALMGNGRCRANADAGARVDGEHLYRAVVGADVLTYSITV